MKKIFTLLFATIILLGFTTATVYAKESDKIKIIAHRGYSSKYPENTILAFEQAAKAGADGIEFDIQMTKDGVPVIIHDHTIDRTTNGKGHVKEMTFEEIRKLDAGSGQKIPTLKEVLDVAKKHHLIAFAEIKNYRTIDDVDVMVEEIKQSGIQNVVVISFHTDALKRVREISREMKIAYLVTEEARLLHAYKKVRHDRNSSICGEHLLLKENARLIRKVHGVSAWTVNSKKEMEKLIRIGVKFIITDVLLPNEEA